VSVPIILPTVASPRSDSPALSRSEFSVSSSHFCRGVQRSTRSGYRSLPQPPFCVSRGLSSLFLSSSARFRLSRSESLCRGRCSVRPPFSTRRFHVAWPGVRLPLHGFHHLEFSSRSGARPGRCSHRYCCLFSSPDPITGALGFISALVFSSCVEFFTQIWLFLWLSPAPRSFCACYRNHQSDFSWLVFYGCRGCFVQRVRSES
jgi:hypothetical protein